MLEQSSPELNDTRTTHNVGILYYHTVIRSVLRVSTIQNKKKHAELTQVSSQLYNLCSSQKPNQKHHHPVIIINSPHIYLYRGGVKRRHPLRQKPVDAPRHARNPFPALNQSSSSLFYTIWDGYRLRHQQLASRQLRAWLVGWL